MNTKPINHRRTSRIPMAMGKIYSWTAGINSNKRFLVDDARKDLILDSMEWLSKKGLVDIYAFIIMPSLIQLVWKINYSNKSENAAVSLLKYTAHQFKRNVYDQRELALYKVVATNKKYEFWQPGAEPVEIVGRRLARDTLTRMHHVPTKMPWQLCNDPCDYWYSSARFYENGIRDFNFIKNMWDVIQ